MQYSSVPCSLRGGGSSSHVELLWRVLGFAHTRPWLLLVSSRDPLVASGPPLSGPHRDQGALAVRVLDGVRLRPAGRSTVVAHVEHRAGTVDIDAVEDRRDVAVPGDHLAAHLGK